MKITLNGAEFSCQPLTTLEQLLITLDLVGKRLAIELNGHIIPKSQHATTPLNTDDRVEIIHAVGGG